MSPVCHLVTAINGNRLSEVADSKHLHLSLSIRPGVSSVRLTALAMNKSIGECLPTGWTVHKLSMLLANFVSMHHFFIQYNFNIPIGFIYPHAAEMVRKMGIAKSSIIIDEFGKHWSISYKSWQVNFHRNQYL